MSGRAGRRGKDERGICIIMIDEQVYHISFIMIDEVFYIFNDKKLYLFLDGDEYIKRHGVGETSSTC